MSISGVGSTLSSAFDNPNLDRAYQVQLLKKTIEIEGEAAVQLINSLPQPPPVSESQDHLGTNIDVRV